MANNAAPFSVTEEDRGAGIYYLRAHGRIGVTESSALERKLESALRARTTPTYIILNMSHVNYLSSGGIRVLLATYKRANKLGVTFCIDYPSEEVRNVLGTVALDRFLMK